MKFLIVEDEAVSRLLLQRILQNQGYEVLVAKDGQEGWEIFQKEKKNIYLLVVDWMMPVMNGLELCKKIRKAETSHYVYIIFLSAKGEKKDIVKGLKAGADDYLTKPF
ncbi:MAG: response regulator, partial [Desulfurellaceae bacterium]|nr:response regulator [Desulfurellaceae bacterium]